MDQPVLGTTCRPGNPNYRRADPCYGHGAYNFSKALVVTFSPQLARMSCDGKKYFPEGLSGMHGHGSTGHP